ncbi:hypothetical protein B0A50_07526 [Salinomyces thailandicus]|uniref:Uncharacterized protein n=1 Tax=Salinomyces thailandicus TaxID=706561 RepID=A0A4U0TMV4_9PEZI|nr:hypothetical protein B0A50_07526 [Salinomyces thailandica]
MAKPISEADIIFNRTNVALARSQRLIESWLPAKLQAVQDTPGHGALEDNDNEEDLKGLDETVGLGSKRKAQDDGLPEGALRRKKLASNERLLEQILGKKAAQARKKGDRGKQAGQEHAGAKPMPVSARNTKQEVESDEEEGGRSALFTSKKQRQRAVLPGQAPVLDGVDGQLEGVARLGGEQIVDQGAHQAQRLDTVDSETEQRPLKRKTGSYLDEVLGQKAKKKSKKRKKADATQTTQ